MKKMMLATLIVVFTFMNVNAQDHGDYEMGLGLGLNFSNVSDLDSENSTDSRISFNINASTEYYFSDRWGIKAKLIYDQKGWANGFIFNTDTFDSVTTDFKVNYLTIPVMANWHFGSTRKWYLNFGPYIGLLLNAEDSELGMDLKEGFKSTDFGFAFGIGYKFPINDATKLFVEYEGQSGLSDIFEDNQGETIRNGRSSFNLGVVFAL